MRRKELTEGCVCVWRFGPRDVCRGSHHPDYDPEVVGEDVVKVRIEGCMCGHRVCTQLIALSLKLPQEDEENVLGVEDTHGQYSRTRARMSVCILNMRMHI